jgi:hypothetical protein
MDADDVYSAEMPQHPSRPPAPLDDDLAERLLSDRLDPRDAPPGYAEVARLLHAAAGPARPDELTGQPAALAAFRVAVRPPAPARRARGRLAARRRGRLAVVALTLAGALFAGGAAAATGGLPAPVERMARTVGRIGGQAPADPVRVLPPAPTAAPARADVTGRRPPAIPSTGRIARPDRPGHAGPPKPKPKPKPKHGRWAPGGGAPGGEQGEQGEEGEDGGRGGGNGQGGDEDG